MKWQWWYFYKIPRFLHPLGRKVCGIITNHPLSSTEIGYGGGRYMDCHCKYCDKLTKVPTEECCIEDRSEMFQHLFKELKWKI